MKSRICKKDCKDENGNCPILGLDNLPVQCVGPWAEDKYYFLERYLNATREVRRKFTDLGNGVFIDLFAGPGKYIIREEQKEILGGAIRALFRDEAPFNECYYFDINQININALTQRIGDKDNCYIKHGDSNDLVKELVARLLNKSYRYHFAFIDSFGPDDLKFDTLAELARLNRMDMLIHFPIGAIKRNIDNWIKKDNTILDDFLGTNIWRKEIEKTGKSKIYKVLINIFKEQLKNIGYPEEGLKLAASDRSIDSGLPTVPVKNTKDVSLYVLILVSKNPLGPKIWQSVIKINRKGQKEFF